MKHNVYYKQEDGHVLIEYYPGNDRVYKCQNCIHLFKREPSSGRLYYNLLCLDEDEPINCNEQILKEILE